MLIKRELEHTGVEPEKGQVCQRKVPRLQHVPEQVSMSIGAGVHIPWAPSKQRACVSISRQSDCSLTLTLLRWRYLPHSWEGGARPGNWVGATPLAWKGTVFCSWRTLSQRWCSTQCGERPPLVNITSAKDSNLKPTLVPKG